MMYLFHVMSKVSPTYDSTVHSLQMLPNIRKLGIEVPIEHYFGPCFDLDILYL